MKIDRFEQKLNTVDRTSFGFAEDLERTYKTVRRLIENDNFESLDAQYEDFRSNISAFFDEPERVKKDDLKRLFNLADDISLEEIKRDVRNDQREIEEPERPDPDPQPEQPQEDDINPVVIYAMVAILGYVIAR